MTTVDPVSRSGSSDKRLLSPEATPVHHTRDQPTRWEVSGMGRPTSSFRTPSTHPRKSPRDRVSSNGGPWAELDRLRHRIVATTRRLHAHGAFVALPVPLRDRALECATDLSRAVEDTIESDDAMPSLSPIRNAVAELTSALHALVGSSPGGWVLLRPVWRLVDRIQSVLGGTV